MPTCIITAPANGTSFALNSAITIDVNASDSNGTITSVNFYINNVLYYTDNSSPYSYIWNSTGFTAGTYTIKTKATDNSNNETTNEISISLIQPVTQAIIGSGTSVTGTSDASPVNVWFKSLHGQSVYTKAELNAAEFLVGIYYSAWF